MIETVIRILILAAVALLPFGTRWIIAPGNLNGYWEYGTVSLYVSEVFVVLAFLVSIFSSLRGTQKQSEIAAPSPRVRWLAATLLGALIGLLIYRGHNLGWSIHVSAAVLFAILLYRYRAHREQFLKVFVVSAVLQSLFGIIQIIFQRVPASTWLGTALQLPQTLGASVVMFHGERFLRAYGMLSHPNIFGAYAVVGVLGAIMLVKDSVRKYFWFVAALICSTGVMLSFSRSAWISLAILLGVLCFKHRDTKVVRQGSVAMVILAGIFVAVFYATITARLVVSGPLEARSISERTVNAHEAWQLFKRHPLLGVGGGNYTHAVHGELDSKRESWGYQPVHNILLLMLVELGIVGVVALGTLFFLYRPQIGLGFVALIPFLLTDHFLWTLGPGVLLFCFLISVDYYQVIKNPQTYLRGKPGDD